MANETSGAYFTAHAVVDKTAAGTFIPEIWSDEIIAAYHQPSRPLTNKPVNWYTDRWIQAGDNAAMPGAANAIDAYQSDLVVEDGSYMRIKQLQLGYTFANELIEKAHLKKLILMI